MLCSAMYIPSLVNGVVGVLYGVWDCLNMTLGYFKHHPGFFL